MFRSLSIALSLGCILVLAACGGEKNNSAPAKSPEPSPTTPSSTSSTDKAPTSEKEFVPDPETGKALFTQFCVTCHGNEGKGDGPAGMALNPKPRDLTDGNYMNAIDQAQMTKVIREGGIAVGKSVAMPGWGHSLSDEQTRHIIAFIRSIANPPYTGKIE